MRTADSKSGVLQGTVGSNPTLSAIGKSRSSSGFFFASIQTVVRGNLPDFSNRGCQLAVHQVGCTGTLRRSQSNSTCTCHATDRFQDIIGWAPAAILIRFHPTLDGFHPLSAPVSHLMLVGA